VRDRPRKSALEGLEIRRAPRLHPVIFGASGDLTKRKLFPALYSLAYRLCCPRHFALVGVSAPRRTDDEFRDRMKERCSSITRRVPRTTSGSCWRAVCRYVAMDFGDEERRTGSRRR